MAERVYKMVRESRGNFSNLSEQIEFWRKNLKQELNCLGKMGATENDFFRIKKQNEWDGIYKSQR